MMVTRPFQARGRRVRPDASVENPPAHVPRVARLMALAIRFDQLIRDGVVADQAELARLGRVSRARLTQIMNLLNLAPDIQEQVLHLQHGNKERGCSERELRPVAAAADWHEQRRRWRTLAGAAMPPGRSRVDDDAAGGQANGRLKFMVCRR